MLQHSNSYPGFFVGNSIGDIGISAINVAYPISAVLQVLGAGLQIIGTGMIPFIRNRGGSFYAMMSMVAGFITNIILDYLFVWVFHQGVTGAAIATVIGQGVTFLTALIYMLRYQQFTLSIPFSDIVSVSKNIIKIGIAPFGLAMTPNISLIIINRFSILYGGEKAVAVYSCIAYIISVVYLIFQGVGDGSQPVFSKFSVPFVAVTRITTASFYATEESVFSYILTYIEPLFMLLFMSVLPPLFGGQIMIWWSTVFARILSALLSLVLKSRVDRKKLAV